MYAVRNKTQADCDTQMMQGPKVSKKKKIPTPIQARIDPRFHVVYSKFWPLSLDFWS